MVKRRRPAGFAARGHDAIQTRLMDGHAARLQRLDPIDIVIRGHDFVTGCRQAAARYQPHIPTADDGQTHALFSPLIATAGQHRPV